MIGKEWSRIPTSQRVVALTFDCGSNAAGVPSILATLRAEGIRATFFLSGRWADLYPRETRAIGSRHGIGNHSYGHRHLPDLPDATVRSEILSAEHEVRAASGRSTKPLFRFPYGDSDRRTLRLVNELGYGSIRWTVDTLGWMGRGQGRTEESLVERVLDRLVPGTIVLMHVGAARDGSTLDADALPALIRGIRERDFRFTTLDPFV